MIVGTASTSLRRAAALGVVCLGLALPAAAAEVAPEGWAYEVSHEIMSPFCPGRSLADCPSPQAESLRAWIVVQEATGRSRADVEAELLERYGDVIRAAPLAEGIGLAAYVIPVVAFVVGGVLVAVFLRRHTHKGASPAPETAEAFDPELARLVDAEFERGGTPEDPSG